ncbi:Ig-like domain-containing protein, partial [Gimesia sp.]|uniref:Ig-like domain-containing protein n=1 Tax=Gimesia sp. TaxID=2024833 RepID=UPI003A955A38
MKSLKRLFGRKSTRKFIRRLPFRISRPIGYASHVERLEDRTLLASNILASLESSVNQPNDTTELLLNIGPGSSPTLGFEVHATPGSAFNPAAIQLINTSTNAVVPLNLAENDHAGTSNSLTLATLAPGEYSLLVHGQTSATGGFIVDVFLPGDSDGSGTVSDTEYNYALAASYQNLFGFNSFTSQFYIQSMGLNPNTNFYSPEYDSDMDGDVDNNDLQMMNSNRNIAPIQLQLIGDQDAPAVIAGLEVDSGVSNSDGITNELKIVGTVTDESLITQFKVSLNGGSYVDIFGLISGGASGGTFTLDRTFLNSLDSMNGGSGLEGGVHTLYFLTVDEHTNVSAVSAFTVSFVLDETDPTVGAPILDQTTHEDFSVDLPTAQDIDLGPLSNYFNQNGGTPLSYQVVSMTEAIVEVDFSTGNLILKSVADAYGTTEIQIQAVDVAGNLSGTSTFSVTITQVNDAPVAVDDDLDAYENIVIGYSAPELLLNDSDVENDTLTVTEVNGSAGNVGSYITIGAGGKVKVESDGSISFDPSGAYESLAADETATETLTYTISDGNGGIDTATVTFTIYGINDDPVANTDTDSTDEDNVTGGNVLTNDTDIDTSDILTVTAVNGVALSGPTGNVFSLSSGAIVTINADGTYQYNPNGAFEDLAVTETISDTFTYTISDGNGGTDTATVTITIDGVNDAPVAENDVFTTDEDTAIFNANLFADTGNGADSDVDQSDSFTVTGIKEGMTTGTVGSAFTLASGATVLIRANGTFDYNPNGAFEGLGVNESDTDTFTYTIDDGNGGTDTATVTITINGVNDAPVAQDDELSTDEDTVLNGNLFDDNNHGQDSDADDNDSFTIVEVNGQTADVGQTITLGTGALLTVNSDGTFSYNPNGAYEELGLNYLTGDNFTYKIQDSQGATDTAFVSISIDGVNDAPTVSAVAISAVEDGPTVNGSFAGDDIDLDDDPGDLTYNITVQPAEGTVQNNNDGTFTFNPGADFQDLAEGETRLATFTYTATDSHGAVSGTQSVTVTVTGVNDTPTTATDSLAATEDGGTVTTGVLADDVDSDDDADSLSYAITNQPIEGIASANGDGTFTFDPGDDFQDLSAGETREVSFTYTATDKHGLFNTGTVTVTVTGVNDPPTAGDDEIDATEDGAPVTTGVLADDVDNDNNAGTLIYAITSQPGEGSASSNGDGTFTF